MQAFEQVWKSITGNPAVSFATKRYTFVTYNANSDVVTPAAGGGTIGVIVEPNNVNQPAQVVAQGYSFIKLGATLTAGAEVMSDVNGAAVAYDSAVAANRKAGVLVVGGANGAIGTVLMR